MQCLPLSMVGSVLRVALFDLSTSPAFEQSTTDHFHSAPLSFWIVLMSCRSHFFTFLLLVFVGGTFPSSGDAEEWKLLWKHNNHSTAYSDPALVEGVIYVGSEDHHFYALHAKDHQVIWSFPTQGQIHGEPLVTQEHVYFESDDRKLYKLHRDSGKLAWSFEIEPSGSVRHDYVFFNKTSSKPAVKDGKVYFGTGNHRAYCLNDADGTLLWSFQAADRIRTDPVFHDGNVYFVSFGPVLYAINAETGTQTWKKKLKPRNFHEGMVLNSPVLFEDMIMMGFRNGNLQCFDTKFGDLLWSLYYGGSWVDAMGLVVDDKLYVGSSDACIVRCIDVRTGRIHWERSVGGRTFGQPAAWKDKVIFGRSGALPGNSNLESGIVALNTSDGKIVQEIKLPLPQQEGPFTPFGVLGDPVVEDGILCFADEEGNLYAYQLNPS